MCVITEVLTCSSRRATQCEVWGFCLPAEPQRSLFWGYHGFDGSILSLQTPRSGWCFYPLFPPCDVSQVKHFRMYELDKWCIDTILCVTAVCLPFVRLEGGSVYSLRACGKRQQSLALDLARHHKHTVLKGVDMTLDILYHNLWPLNVVVAVGEQWSYNLKEFKEMGKMLWTKLLKYRVTAVLGKGLKVLKVLIFLKCGG